VVTEENCPNTLAILADQSVMIVSGAEIEASLVARRLGRWGARTCIAGEPEIARALHPLG
jgi:hypothetical protein